MANPTLEMIHGLLYGKGIRIGRLGGLGRVIAAMTGKHGDTIPFMGAQIHDHAMTVANVPARKYYFDAELLASTQLAVQRWYNLDTPLVVNDGYNLEVEALGAKMIYSDFAMPTVDTNFPIIKEHADLDRLGRIDLTKGRIPMGVELARIIFEKVQGPFAAGLFCSPFSFLCQAMGYPKAVRALRRDKVFAQELFDFAENEAIFPYLKAQAEVGAKSANGADAWAAFPNLTPEMVDEWVVPSADRLRVRGKKELGMTVAAGTAACDYCEEDPDKFVKEIMFKCWDVAAKTSPVQVAFSAMGRTQDWNMAWLQEYAESRGGKRKIPIMASMNGRFMRDSSPEDIVNKVREWIDIMGRDGGLLFLFGNVPADTPPINMHTAVQAVKKLGTYPIVTDLLSIQIRPPQFQTFDDWVKDQPEADVIFNARE